MMLDFQSCLFAFILCIAASSASEWKAEIPNSVVGVSGSCVVIPCKFNYPSDGKTYSDFTGIWYKDETDVIYHKETSKINSGFKDRTSLLGDLHHKNCTLKVSSLKHSDSNIYMFRIEIKDFDNYSYYQNKVSLTVTDSPEQPTVSVEAEVTTQREVTATCVVSHSCPSDPPRLTWSHSGQPKIHTQPEKSQWKLTSSLTFTPSREDHNKTLSCTAEFTGGKKVSNQKTLIVKYPPEIKNESFCKSETFVVCVCIVDSNPPSQVKWFGPSSTFFSSSVQQNGSLTIFTLQGWLGFPNTIHCSASNSEGNSVMTLSAPHGFIVYVVAATAVVVVALLVISVCVAKRHRGRRPAQQRVMDMKNDQNEMKTDPKSCLDSDRDTNYQGNDQNVYKNWGGDYADVPCEGDEDDDEAVYANM